MTTSPDTAAEHDGIDDSDLQPAGRPLISVTSTDQAKLRTCAIEINGTEYRFVEPDSGVQQDMEEAQSTRAILRLLAGRFWSSAMRDDLDSLDREDLIKVIDTIAAEFELDESVMSGAGRGGGRSARRARARDLRNGRNLPR